MAATEDTPQGRLLGRLAPPELGVEGENGAVSPMGDKPAGGDVWLDRLGHVWAADRRGFARRLYHAVFASLLEDEGMDGQAASRVALRVARLAVALLDGAQQKTTAQELDVSPRTAKADAARLRSVLVDGTLAFRGQPEGELPPVPRAPDDRVTLTTPDRRRRRTPAAF